MSGVLCFKDRAGISGELTERQYSAAEASASKTDSTLDLCLCCLREQTQTPLEACLAGTLLQDRADYSRRSEMTKHNLTPLLWRLTSLDSHSDSCKHHPGENVVIMSPTKEI